ncbi:type II secretion system F family protein [Pseudonocardia nigra]|uniref:type II secretion system F family protein n=1 Tax=Pseudonocardia nigra TaxID=1921578 RepID=UPI001C5DFAB0|nr:type II secretion system F family protein [Pseudonocardia nigra]
MMGLLAVIAGAALATAPLVVIAAFPPPVPGPASAPGALRRRLLAARTTAHAPDRTRNQQRVRVLGWSLCGIGVWVVTAWPAAGTAVAAVGLWGPWLLGSARVTRERIDGLEALESWCRRMADTLAGGGAVGLAQAVTATAPHVDNRIENAVQLLAGRLRDEQTSLQVAMREFADALDDRVGDTVAAALLLALHQQSAGVARVLRQLADSVARDVRARRQIEAERAESRQSIRMLLLIQAAVLVMLALVPSFAAPYSTPLGQVVMSVLLAGTIALLIWMRRLAIGRRAPRFLGAGVRQ